MYYFIFKREIHGNIISLLKKDREPSSIKPVSLMAVIHCYSTLRFDSHPLSAHTLANYVPADWYPYILSVMPDRA